ncbi:23238_t:CDS:2 [Entrophospora sp. SA101]|nr:23238_t:CDS:2 [Entrophospora sp. SA101]
MSPDQVVLKIAKNVQPKDLTAIIAIDGMRSAAICNQRAFLPISPLSPPKRQGMPVFVDNNLIDILVNDLKKLSVILDIKESYLIDDLDKSYFPTRGGLINMPPSDPFLYRFYEILQVYGYPLKSIVNEKFGDGIMSAIDFTANVDKVKKEDQERVKITFEGKFLPYKKW